MRKSVKHFLPLLLFALLAIGMTYPLLFNMTNHIPSDLGDPLYNVWVMARNLHSISTGLKNFWDTNIFYPHQRTLLYADYMIALSVFASPILAISGNLIFTYNFLFILSFFLCAAGMYFLVLRLTSFRSSAIIASLIFAFIPYRFAHISHLELLYSCWMPFCLLFLYEFFEDLSYKNLFSIAFFYILQALTCAYYGVYLTLFIGLYILFFAYKKRLLLQTKFWVRIGILSAVCFIILIPFFYPYLLAHEKMLFTRPLLTEVKYFSAQLQHFLAVPPWNLTWGWLTGSLGTQEWQLYPGIIPLFLTIFWWIKKPKVRKAKPKKNKAKIFLWWDRLIVCYLTFLLLVMMSGGFRIQLGGLKLLSVHNLRNPLIILSILLLLRLTFDRNLRYNLRKFIQRQRHAHESIPSIGLLHKFYLYSVIIAWILSLGPAIKFLGKEIAKGPYLLLYNWIPAFQGLRVPARFVVIMMLGLSVMSGWGVAQLIERMRSFNWKIIVTAVLVGLILLDYISIPIPLARVKTREEIPPIYSTLRSLPDDSVIIEIPMPEHDWERSNEALYMYYSIYHRKQLVNGYSGYFPPGYSIIRKAMEYFPSKRTFKLLKNLEVDYILVHTEGYRGEKGRETVRFLKHFKNQVKLIEKTHGDYLYLLLPLKIPEQEEKALTVVGERKKWKARSNLNNNLTKLAFDNNPNTKWSTYLPQKKGDYFLLDLGSKYKLRKVELLLDNDPLDYPRGYVLEGSVDMNLWTFLSKNPSYFPELSLSMIENYSKYRVEISFEPCEVRYLRITLIRSHENRKWSIHEIICKE